MFWAHGSSVNFTIGELEERAMLSGLHTVADIFCCCCGQMIGWKYVILPLTVSFSYFSTWVWFSLLESLFCINAPEIFYVSTRILTVPTSCHISFYSFNIVSLSLSLSQESAHDKSQKYKEGKFVLERYISLLCHFSRLWQWVLLYPPKCVYTDSAYRACPYYRGRIVDEIGFSTEFYIDGHVSMSDAEDA